MTLVRPAQRADKPGLGDEPDFDGIVVGDENPPTLRGELLRLVCWLILYPALVFFGGLFALGVASMIVTALNDERLHRPVAVRAIDGASLLLADGRRVPLRFLGRVPGDDPVFRSAIKKGVEVDGRGDVFGLLTVSANCGGMTLQSHHVTRVNLRDLAAVARPDCVDGSALVPDELALLKEYHGRVYARSGRVYFYPFVYDCGYWHDAFERAAARSREGRASGL